MDGDPGPLPPAKTPWTHDSFAVSGRKLSSWTTEKIVTKKLSQVEVIDMTYNRFLFVCFFDSEHRAIEDFSSEMKGKNKVM